MKFEVAYRTADGNMAETIIEVSDRNAVYSELRRQGITPISLHEAGTKKRDKKSDGGKLSSALKIVLLAVLLSAAVFAAWYFFAADDGAKQRVKDLVARPSKIEMHQTGPAPTPRKGTGAVSVKISE
jgi:type II secretory pathway component PulF